MQCRASNGPRNNNSIDTNALPSNNNIECSQDFQVLGANSISTTLEMNAANGVTIDTGTEPFFDLSMENLLKCDDVTFDSVLDTQHKPAHTIHTQQNRQSTLQQAMPTTVTLTATDCQSLTAPSGIYRKSSIFAAQTVHEQRVKFDDNSATVQQETKKIATDQTVSEEPSKISDNGQYDALARLAYNIYQLAKKDHIVINRKLNEIVRTDATTNQKTIYRLTTPLALGMNNAPAREPINKRKPGRPRKRIEVKSTAATTRLNTTKMSRSTSTPTTTGTTVPTSHNAQPTSTTAATMEAQHTEADATTPIVRTRFGRIVRSVQPQSSNDPMQTNQNIIGNASSPVPTAATVATGGFIAASNMIDTSLSELKDKDFKSCAATKELKVPALPTKTIPSTNPTTACNESLRLNYLTDDCAMRPRRVPQNAICPTCNKIFLGRRLERHYVKHPDHMILSPDSEQFGTPVSNAAAAYHSSTFNYLVTKLQRSTHLSEEQRADLFLNELNDFIEQLQLRSSRLIRNASGLHFVNARTARVLAIPEGQYALDMSAIESPHIPDADHGISSYDSSSMSMPTAPTLLNARNIVDYTALSMSIDDTFTDEAAQKLNLSAGGKLLPPSEESLLRAVDDLMTVRINKMDETALLQPRKNSIDIANSSHAMVTNDDSNVRVGVDVGVGDTVDGPCPVNGSDSVEVVLPHYVHVSDNAVEADNMKETSDAAILDLNVDFFQFNNGNGLPNLAFRQNQDPK